jgi:hypothetical protein
MFPPAPLWSSLSLAQIEELRERWLCRGGAWKADLSLVSRHGERAVLKDFSAKGALPRLLGRLQIQREARVYETLAGLAGVPRLLARPCPEALLLGYVDGRRLSKERGAPDAARLAGSLAELVEAIHRRGVAHVDLRGRDNILVDSARRVWVLDFGASWTLAGGGPLRRALFALGRFIDRAAILKWRLLLAPEGMARRERARHARFRRLRRLWPFNPKGGSPRAHAQPR